MAEIVCAATTAQVFFCAAAPCATSMIPTGGTECPRPPGLRTDYLLFDIGGEFPSSYGLGAGPSVGRHPGGRAAGGGPAALHVRHPPPEVPLRGAGPPRPHVRRRHAAVGHGRRPVPPAQATVSHLTPPPPGSCHPRELAIYPGKLSQAWHRLICQVSLSTDGGTWDLKSDFSDEKYFSKSTINLFALQCRNCIWGSFPFSLVLCSLIKTTRCAPPMHPQCLSALGLHLYTTVFVSGLVGEVE